MAADDREGPVTLQSEHRLTVQVQSGDAPRGGQRWEKGEGKGIKEDGVAKFHLRKTRRRM